VENDEHLVYPPECVDRLLDEIKKCDDDDPPGNENAGENNSNRNRYRPLPPRMEMRTLLDLALAASQAPEEGAFPQFSLAYVPPDGLVEKRYDVCPFAEATALTIGMRHRSAAQFCANHSGQALTLVVSQDGDVTLVWRGDDATVHKIGPYASGIGVAM
jgi:hypothetical protein